MSNPSHLVQEVAAPVAVVRIDGHYRVLGTRLHERGALLLRVEGVVTTTPTRYSVQVGAEEHVDLPEFGNLERCFDANPWRFLNHSCDPNAVLRGRQLRALRRIEPWEQISFDYNTTERSLAVPFSCQCGATNCLGEIRGFDHLSEAEREQRKPLLAAHLRERWEAQL